MSKCEECTCKACKTVVFSLSNMQICDVFIAVFVVAAQEPEARFSKVPKLFGRISGYIFLFVSSKRKASRGMKLCSYFTLYSLYNMKRPALQDKWVAVLPVASRARKICETFEERTPGAEEGKVIATNTTNAKYRSRKHLKSH